MKKVMNWMFAAILICGSSVVMSSCGDDDNDNGDKGGGKLTPNTYEVTLSAVLPQSAAEFFTMDLEYAVAGGNTNKVTVKAGDNSDQMSEQLKKIYDKEKKSVGILMKWDNKPEKMALFDQLIVKNVSFTVPAGKSFSYKATMNVRPNYTQPSSDSIDIIKPFVYYASKRISGNSEDKSVSAEGLKLKAYGAVESENLDEYIDMFDGEVVATGTVTIN